MEKFQAFGPSGNVQASSLPKKGQRKNLRPAEKRLENLSFLPSAVESVQVLSTKEDAEALPIMCCFRNPESAQLLREALLQDGWKTRLGKTYDLGFRPCRAHVGGP